MNSYIIGLLVVIVISTLAGWYVSSRKQAEKAIKIMLFLLYFWVFAFLQIALFAVVYYFFF